MKRLIFLITFAVALASAAAAQQRYASDSLISSSVTVASNGTTTVTSPKQFDLRGTTGLVIEATIAASAGSTTTSNVVFTFQTSLDGSTWGNPFSVTNALSGTSSVTTRVMPAATNYQYFRYVRPYTIRSFHTNVVTCSALKYGFWYTP